jgi:protein-export membrane protein SecD
MANFGFTLTLPGIAGIILTIGMAVDANVLIFERIREELKSGKTLRASVDIGYGKAFWTIFDSNLTTLITAVVLYQFGTGPIRGFAVTLTIGIIISMFTAIFVTRIIFDYLISRKNVQTLSI